MINPAVRHFFNKLRIPLAIVLLAFLVVSIVVLRPIASSSETYQVEISSLDARRDTVLQLIASSSAASAVITLIPDDVGTPIAQQLAGLSAVFTFILAVLLAEKYLLPILGGFTTTILIPLTCLMWSVYLLFYSPQWLKNMIFKFAVLCLALITVIPLSVFISGTIETTFGASINSTINAALDSEEKLTADPEPEPDQNLWERVTGTVNNAIDYAGKALDIAKETLSNYADAVAVSLVISCVIPILVLFAYLMTIKFVFSLDFSIREGVRKTILLYRKPRKKPADQN